MLQVCPNGPRGSADGATVVIYGADGRREALGYAVFDVGAEIDGTVRWLDAAELLGGELPLMPRLYEGRTVSSGCWGSRAGGRPWAGGSCICAKGS